MVALKNTKYESRSRAKREGLTTRNNIEGKKTLMTKTDDQTCTGALEYFDIRISILSISQFAEVYRTVGSYPSRDDFLPRAPRWRLSRLCPILNLIFQFFSEI